MQATSRNLPVESITMLTPNTSQGISAGRSICTRRERNLGFTRKFPCNACRSGSLTSEHNR